ncbi:MAG: DUF4886 domain-containing protein [Ruminococcaceae bacterium]|nr:DUF4886 domain-containing protein [Oscillospiraceae bacterium]
MKKICLLLALIMLVPSFVSCTPQLAEAPAEVSATETETEPAEVVKKDPKPAKKEETVEETIMQESNPAEDDVINVLMIGNSFCYYYVEELYGIAKAAGVNMKVCNVYYSGCKLVQHWTWWKQDESHYQYFETDGSGRSKIADPTNLRYCLSRENWDVISFQQGVISQKGDLQASKDAYYKYLTPLYEYVKGQFPQSNFYWHQTWSYQVGYDRNGYQMKDAQQQAQTAKWSEEFAIAVCQDYPMTRIPCGTAWQYARNDSRVGDVLCNRGKKSDNYHDGDEGGGQYLNACVWFETITGQNCIGNTWRPTTYSLSETKIAALQQAAHRAVAESRGEI